MRRYRDITHIGRTIDPRLPSNLFALAASTIGGLISLVLERDIGQSVTVGMATFGGWALARDLDPDRTASAASAAVSAAIVTLWLGTPGVLPLYMIVVTARLLARTTGLPPMSSDLAVVSVIVIIFAGTPWGWATGIVLAFAIVRDATLVGDPPPRAAAWGLGTALGVTVRVALSDTLGIWPTPTTEHLAIASLGIAAALVVIRPVPVLSLGDWTEKPLDPARIRQARLFAIAAAILTAIVGGAPGILTMAPVFLTYGAIAAQRLMFEKRQG